MLLERRYDDPAKRDQRDARRQNGAVGPVPTPIRRLIGQCHMISPSLITQLETVFRTQILTISKRRTC
jgi:hypothetical protein